MARYLGAACRICRRQGMKLFLKGTKCMTDKCPFNRRGYAPGEHGKMRVKLSDYGLQLREKQKVKHLYGLMERPFRRVFEIANRAKGVTGEKLLELLERRLDNVVYRLGYASSRSQARQFVRHGHVQLGDRPVTIPSFEVKPGQVVRMVGSEKFLTLVKEIRDAGRDRSIPTWLKRPEEELRGEVLALPKRGDVQFPISERLIVELYSK